jgi:CDP-glycerol glycerophosphotransferase
MSGLVDRRVVRESLFAIKQLVAAALAWLFAFPLTWVIGRDEGLTVVVGRGGRAFADNSKYFFIYASLAATEGRRCVFLAGHRSIQRAICEAGGEAVLHPSWRSVGLLLRCGTLCTDWADWTDYGGYPLTRGATRVQMWHGAPLKHIELDVFRKRLAGLPFWQCWLLGLQKAVIGRFAQFDVVLATSQRFVEDVFRRCFKSREFLSAGYPRNDVLFGGLSPASKAYRLAEINVDQVAFDAVALAKEAGQKICLYAPTFRKSMGDPFQTDINLAQLAAFGKQHNILFVLKLHPSLKAQGAIEGHSNLLEYAPLGDVYPLMGHCDMLITDYSSIYFDYLLLDRPMVFFAYDLDRYLSEDREMYFDYDAMTPGAKCRNQAELEQEIENILAAGGDDGFAAMRATVRRYTHDHVDDKAAERLYEYLASR